MEETETVEAPEPEVVEGTDPEVAVTEDFEPEAEVDENPVTATDNRSPNGQFHGGHRGSVSTLARAGLGPVFGNLRSQGYGDIQIEQIGDEITLEAFTRDGRIRKLTYDATTGALLSDEQGQPEPDPVDRQHLPKGSRGTGENRQNEQERPQRQQQASLWFECAWWRLRRLQK